MPDAPGAKTTDISPVANSLATRFAEAWQVLRGRRFTTGQPRTPSALPGDAGRTTVDGKRVDTPLAPRLTEIKQFSNMQVTPRQEFPQLTPFDQLRNLADLYDIAAVCIVTRIEEMQGMRWSVVASDKKKQAELQPLCDAVAKWWRTPDNVTSYQDWLGQLLYEMFSIDALTLYRRPAADGTLYGLEVIDGATIKPLQDWRGRVVAYQQVLWGMPETEFKPDFPLGDDIEDTRYDLSELMYLPRWRRTRTPYGFPPTERIIMRVNMALRKMNFDLAYFTQGNIPDMIASAPDGMMSVTQLREFEKAFNEVLIGADGQRRRMRFLPWKADVKELRPFSYDTQLDDWMMRVTCASYGVTPAELGWVESVNKANGEMQENITYRRGLGPLTTWLKDTIFDKVIQRDLPKVFDEKMVAQLEWSWNYGEEEDKASQAQSDKLYFDMGVLSNDEIRTLRFGDVVDGPAPTPPVPPAGANPTQEPMSAVQKTGAGAPVLPAHNHDHFHKAVVDGFEEAPNDLAERQAAEAALEDALSNYMFQIVSEASNEV